MLIDAHVHLLRDGSIAANLFGKSASPQQLLDEMDRARVDAAIVVGLPGLQDHAEILEACSVSPDRLFPLAGINPSNPSDVSEMKHVKERGFYGIKLHPRLNGYAPDASIVNPVMEEARRRQLPVLIDTLPQCADIPLADMEYHAFDRLARRFPDVTLVLAHACAPHILEAYTIAKANPNVYLEMSMSLLYYAGTYVESAIRFVSDRLDRFTIYGSDFPQYQVGEYLKAYEKLIENAGGVDREKVFAGNATKVYGLPLTAQSQISGEYIGG